MKSTSQLLRRSCLISSVFFLATFSLQAQKSKDAHAGHSHHAFGNVKQLTAVLSPTEGSTAKGLITFTQLKEGGVKIVAKLSGLKPNSKHAIHIHEFGDISVANGTGTGGHYNPEGHDHALPDKNMRHAGDLGNLEANDKGEAELSLTVTNVSLVGSKNPIVGRGVIVHAGEDDGGQPTGNAGARISQGVIGIAKPAAE